MGLTICRCCRRDVPDFARVCEHCGSQLDPPSISPDFSLQSSDPPATAIVPVPTELPVALPKAPSRAPLIALATAAMLAGAGLTLWMLTGRPGAQAAVSAASSSAASRSAAAAKAPPDPPSIASSAPAPSWNASSDRSTAGGPASAAFELPADNHVAVWMRSVRPILVVRCDAGRADAFVHTASAAQMEPRTEDHTVTYAFDEESGVSQRWPDSEEHDALFPPDGATFAARVAGARVLRFSFTPHNAAPVTAQFTVSGLAAAMGPAARHCGWAK